MSRYLGDATWIAYKNDRGGDISRKQVQVIDRPVRVENEF
jgi:hypothetical protein